MVLREESIRSALASFADSSQESSRAMYAVNPAILSLHSELLLDPMNSAHSDIPQFIRYHHCRDGIHYDRVQGLQSSGKCFFTFELHSSSIDHSH